jgi:hypothetical protein
VTLASFVTVKVVAPKDATAVNGSADPSLLVKTICWDDVREPLT